MREVWTGGEVVPAAAVRRVLAACPGLTVVDGYGPTETTTFATRRSMSAPVTRACGRADRTARWTTCASTSWTTRLRPVPPGMPGELYIAGAGLARGYLRPARG